MDVELKHTWRISRAAWYIRLYIWVWDASEADITFCKLWWAYVFMWLALPLKCWLVIMAGVIRAVKALLRGARHSLRRGCWPKRSPKEGSPTISAIELELLSNLDTAPKRAEWIAAFLKSVPKVLPKRQKQEAVVTDKSPSFMRSLLGHIEYAGSWLGMHRQLVTTPLRRGLTALGGAVAWVIAMCIVAPVYYIAKSGVFIVVTVSRAFLFVVGAIATGLLFITEAAFRALEWAMPPVARVAARSTSMIAKGLYIASWPLRRALWYGWRAVETPITVGLDLISRLSFAGRLTAYGIVGVTIAAWALVPVVAVSAIFVKLAAHPWAIVLVLGSFALCLAVGLFMGWLLSLLIERYFAPTAYRYVVKPTATSLGYGADATSKTVVGFGRVMLIGIKSVKANTCPRVEIED